jgi:hypothetical protein
MVAEDGCPLTRFRLSRTLRSERDFDLMMTMSAVEKNASFSSRNDLQQFTTISAPFSSKCSVLFDISQQMRKVAISFVATLGPAGTRETQCSPDELYGINGDIFCDLSVRYTYIRACSSIRGLPNSFV